mmetsp:Transcript_52266/g.56675  ORF Transcript_52266/g.56675 Transcript_52266/m.56675 type:complete len:113 (-) Transcript_52266:450-788(-)
MDVIHDFYTDRPIHDHDHHHILFGITASTIYDPAAGPLLDLDSDHQYSDTLFVVFLLFFCGDEQADSSSSSSSSSSKSGEDDDETTRTRNCCESNILDCKRICAFLCRTRGP